MIDNHNTIIYIAAGKQILKPEDAYLEESCLSKIGRQCLSRNETKCTGDAIKSSFGNIILHL